MTDKEKKSKIADILMDFQEEYDSDVVNRPMIASIYAGKILSFIDSMQDLISDDLDMDLEKEIDRYWNSLPIGVVYRPHWGPFQQIARHFVEWQEKKDKAENDAIKKLLEDFDKQYDEGFITGQKLLREQMVRQLEDIVYRRYSDEGDPDQRNKDLIKLIQNWKEG